MLKGDRIIVCVLTFDHIAEYIRRGIMLVRRICKITLEGKQPLCSNRKVTSAVK